MSEYSVYFNPPGFDDYPRTVQDTVDHVALNAHVERTDVADIYVTGSTIPSIEDNNKIWIHYPNSTVPPPQPGVDPNLPTPQPLSYFPGSTRAIGTLASIPNPYSVFLDEQTQNIWVGSSSLTLGDSVVLWKIDSNLNITSYSVGDGSTNTGSHVCVTPSGRVFVLCRMYNTPPLTRLYELVNGSLVLRYSSSSTANNSGLISDSSGNLYFSNAGNAVFKISASNFTISTFGYVSLGAGTNYILGFRFNSSGDLIVVHGNTNSTTYIASIPAAGGVASTLLGPLTLSPYVYWANSLALDSSGNFYVSRFSLVYKITPGGIVSIETGSTTAGYFDGEYSSALFNGPVSIFISSTNNLYVADRNNSKIRATSGSTNTFSTVQNPDFIAVNLSVPFSYNLTATNSPTSYGANSLPTGLTINTSTGLVSGTPSATGVFSSTMQAENAFGGSIKGTVFNVQQYIPTNYYNTPALRRFTSETWYGFENVQRGDIILAPEEQTVLFPWGESGKAYDLSQFGQPIFQVPTLPTPPAGFVYKYYIGARISQPTPPVITP